MGRKPKLVANANEGSSPPLESMKDEQKNPTNILSNKEASPGRFPSKKKLSQKLSPSSLPSKMKASKKSSSNMNVDLRRSGRLRNLRSAMPNQEMIAKEIDLSDSGREEEPLVQQLNSEPLVQQLNSELLDQQLNSELLDQQLNSEPLVQQLNTEPFDQQFNSEPLVQQLNTEPLDRHLNAEPISDQHDLKDKIDFLVECVKEFKAQGKKRPFPRETQPMEFNYRILYNESQKKIEALTEENHQLAKKLEFASGKIEAFEKMNGVLGNLKDMVFISNLGRTTEAVMNLSAQAGTGNLNLPEVATNNAAAHVDEQRTTSPVTRKNNVRKKK